MSGDAQWSVLDARDSFEWIDRVGIRLPPYASGRKCLVKDHNGFVCMRVTGHGGRHAACTIDRELVAVWR